MYTSPRFVKSWVTTGKRRVTSKPSAAPDTACAGPIRNLSSETPFTPALAIPDRRAAEFHPARRHFFAVHPGGDAAGAGVIPYGRRAREDHFHFAPAHHGSGQCAAGTAERFIGSLLGDLRTALLPLWIERGTNRRSCGGAAASCRGKIAAG